MKRKNLIFGLLVVTLLFTTAATVSKNSIQASIFPLKFLFNGKSKDLGAYTVLNYHNSTYVPTRFIVENTNADVVYDEKKKTIIVRSFDPTKPILKGDLSPNVLVGNVKVVNGKVTGIMSYIDDTPNREEWHTFVFKIIFYDEHNNKIGESEQVGTHQKEGEILDFTTTFEGDISKYSTTSLYMTSFEDQIRLPD
jgi:hypothetical protein